ncbi:MAG: histone deacetylase [Myxococcota bacterium]|nr:histone deacetylase [Myxococcota bacterium]
MTPAQKAATPARSSKNARALLLDDGRFSLHEPPEHHPERPERLIAARAAVGGVRADFTPIAPRPASDEELLRVHDPRFIEQLEMLRGQSGYLDSDTYLCPESVDVARLAAGSLVAMVDAMITGPIHKGVALLRPPGHHARPAHAMGFCLLNNVAIAAAHARTMGIARVAVVDWDVHHGNGTQEMFLREPGVIYLSTHQSPFYPGTGNVDEVGVGEGKGYTVNVPLAAGAGDDVYASAFERIVLPVLEAYAPQLVLVSAGFDASAADPLAEMELSPGAFGWMAREVARIADAVAGGRMALVLEGGYQFGALQEGLHHAIEGMLLDAAPEIVGARKNEGVERAVGWAKRGWSGVK